MAFSRGRCANFDYCTLADRRQDIEVKLGDNFVCPECAKALMPPPARKGVAVAQLALIGAAAVTLVGGGVWAGMTLLHPAPVLVAKAPPVAPAAVPVQLPPETVLLRLAGSNTIGANLGPQLARAFLADTGDTNVTIEPTGKPDEVKVAGLRGDKREAITIAAHGSATAFTDLASGAADVGMASRRIKPAENETLAPLGNMTSATNEHVLALDGIAVIVNPGNSIPSLTKDQLRDIFNGTTQNWSAIGAPAGVIHVLARDDKSGTFDTFKSLVLGGTKLTPDAKRIEDSRELSNQVAADQNAIGFIGLPYILSARAVPVAETGAASLLPNRLTVGTEDYALSRRLYLYTATQSPNPLVRRFTDFALSPAGQDIVEQNGFVPLTIKSESVPLPQTASTKYRSLIGKATRLSTNFRFEANSVVLDNRAQRDLDRLVNFVLSTHADASQIILVGFADNKGAPAANLTVSKKRAEAVAAGLAQRGLRVGHVAAFGADLPVADNTSDDGREKNRRVEVYLQLNS
jgi:phosphate transport system substrate-binding protein